jgi:hypothetical protein
LDWAESIRVRKSSGKLSMSLLGFMCSHLHGDGKEMTVISFDASAKKRF